MTVGLDHPEVTRYLDRLAAAAAALPPGRRDELVAEIRGHLAESLRAGDATDEAAVRAALDRLGPPEDIVLAEEAATPAPPQPQIQPPGPPPGVRPRLWGPLEIAAVLLLTVGSVVLPVVGPLVGVALAWMSSAWRRHHKIVATVLAALPTLALILVSASVILGGGVTTAEFTETCVEIGDGVAGERPC